VNGYVTAVAPDGSGGWFIGGTFNAVGGLSRANVAHINSDMSVAAWNPGIAGSVNAIAVSGGIVYVGGAFNQAGGQPRDYLAAFNATTGALASWNALCTNTVLALAVSGSTLYVGGDFNSIGGQPRSYLGAVDLTTATATSWAPNPDGSVAQLAVSGTSIYVGGGFLNIAGQPRTRLAEIELGTGAAMPWNPGANNTVVGLAVSASVVYACGPFTTIGGQSRNGLAAIDRTTGNATGWNPSPDAWPSAVADGGSVVYVGGLFSAFQGVVRKNLAALDASTGVPTAWNPSPNDGVRVLTLGRAVVYAGGYFSGFGGVTRNNVAAFDATTGALLSWDPNANSIVYSLAVSGPTVYLGGYFTLIGATGRNQIAAVDAVTGAATSFNPGANGPVFALAVKGGSVYAGGGFTTMGGATRNRLAALTLGGALRSWNPGASAPVSALSLNGPNVYIGGSFTTLGGMVRNYMAAVDSGSGLPTSWNPSANAPVYALAAAGSSMYVGGDFTGIGGASRNRLACLDFSTGLATPWNPNMDGRINAILPRLTLVYVGGDFYTAGGLARHALAAVETATGSVARWSADTDFYGVYGLAMSEKKVFAGGTFIGLGTTAQSYFAGIDAAPELVSCTPNTGGNAGPVSVVLQGKAFQTGAIPKLRISGSSDITGTPVQVSSLGDQLTTTFDLTAATAGTWNVQVMNPDQLPALLANSFQVTTVAAPQLRVSIVGPDMIRAGYATAFDLVVENPGNVDAVSVPLWVTNIPPAVTITPDFPVSSPPQSGGEPNWSGVPLTFTVGSGQYLPVVIPRVPPGTLRRRFLLNAPSNVPLMQMGAALAPTWSSGGTFVGCLSSGGVLLNPTCAGPQLASLNSFLAANPQMDGMSGTQMWAKIAWQCEGATDLTTATAKSKQVLDYLEAVIETGTAPSGCSDALLPQWRGLLPIQVVFSIDPNDKLGPTGTVSSTQSIPYSIRFENLATATASVRVLTVVDPLSTTLDLNSLGLDAIDLFGTVQLLPAPGSKQYSHDVDLGHDNLMVRIAVYLDTPSRQLTWSFATLDKTTLQPPANTLLGFLPPNTNPPQGEGSVLFTIRPASSTPNGTVIQNSALISFDGVAQNTPPVSNSLDNTAPASNVMALSNPIPTATFPVNWTASGSPTDLKDFTIYVAEDGGAYQTWKLNTVSTTDSYVPRPGGHTYAFYSVARDLSGNIEPPPPAPDTQTLSTTAVDNSGVWGLSLAGARPNPARDVLRVVFTLPSREKASLELIDVAGRLLSRREVGELGPGSHELVLDPLPRPRAGLYFLRLRQQGSVLIARVVLMGSIRPQP
jgi:hypothetical protein